MTMESNYYSGKGVNHNLNGKYVTALEFAQMAEAVQALQTAVGSANSGLVKDMNTLKTTVGNSSSGLVKDVSDLKTTVGDNTAGLVKRVGDLEAAAES